ncbi:MAG: YARHG domain-containing protein, partial [Atribacterota bacterium]
MIIGIILLWGNVVWAAQLLTPKDLGGKTLQELYFMRNDIYARHGRPFKTY